MGYAAGHMPQAATVEKLHSVIDALTAVVNFGERCGYSHERLSRAESQTIFLTNHHSLPSNSEDDLEK